MSALPTSQRDVVTELSDWIGRSSTVDDEINLSSVRRMAATLDLEPMDFHEGDSLPPHWYTMFFTLNAQRSRIGHDGHPRKGEFLPPIPLPRRMFVGRTARFPGVLRIGDRASKRSVIAAMTQKHGSSGPLAFLSVLHTISVSGQPVITEEQEVVYRMPPSGEAASRPRQRPPASADWQVQWELDPVLVFRYSALTWNSHRIHYDADYARDAEGYRACVMNGGLTIHLVTEEVLRRSAGRRLVSLSARLVSPLFVGGVASIAGRSTTDTTVEAWAADSDGNLAVACTLEFDPA